MVQSGVFGTKLPNIASHEGSGTVVAIGDQVKEFKKEDRVMCGIPMHPCGACKDCLGPETQRQYCTKISHAGVTTDGCFAEYVVVDSRHSAKLPDAVTFETAAPLACAGCTIWKGVLASELKSGEWLALVGSGGGLGHLGIQFAKALGLQVIGIDARDEGLELSRQTGADVVIDARKGKEHVKEEVFKVTNGEGADATVNISDHETAAATACAVTKMHGLMVQIAQVRTGPDFTSSTTLPLMPSCQPDNVSVPFPELIFRDIRIHGSLLCSQEEAKRMLDTVAKHKISVRTNPVHGLKELPKLIDLAHSGKMSGKGICIVDEEQIKKENDLGASQ